MREFQIRVEYEDDGAEDCFTFDTREEAETSFRDHCDRIRAEQQTDDVHVELLEVLQQERIEPPFTQ